MKNSRETILERIDIFETVKKSVLQECPRLSERIALSENSNWREKSTAELQLFATMAFLRWDIKNGSLCRKARGIMKQAQARKKAATNQGVVEDANIYDDNLSEKQLQNLGDTLEHITQDNLSSLLKNSPSTSVAVENIESKLKALKGMKAFEFLENIDYHIVVPDQGRSRWLERMGLLDSEITPKEKRSRSIRLQEEFVHQLGVSSIEFSQVLGAFTGSIGDDFRTAAFCLKTPKCPECPLKEKCPTFRFAKSDMKREHFSLQSKLRKTERPREKLEERGARTLSDEELIAILLRTGSGKLNALELAQKLLHDSDNLIRLSRMSVSELSKYHGLGRVKAITILAAFELASRLNTETHSSARPIFDSSRRVFNYFGNRFTQSTNEEFITLILNTKLELIREVPISTGTLNQSLVHPREAFREAIKESAFAVAFVHNHPSGNPKPSRDDIKITDRLVKAGELLQIKVIDHLIIGSNKYYSFKDEGIIS